MVELIRKDVLASDLLHADDTPIRVLDRAKKGELGKGVKEGRIWAYVRDQRPWSGTVPPAVAYHFSPDRKGEHPQKHLGASKGVLQADAYAGFRTSIWRRGMARPGSGKASVYFAMAELDRRSKVSLRRGPWSGSLDFGFFRRLPMPGQQFRHARERQI